MCWCANVRVCLRNAFGIDVGRVCGWMPLSFVYGDVFCCRRHRCCCFYRQLYWTIVVNIMLMPFWRQAELLCVPCCCILCSRRIRSFERIRTAMTRYKHTHTHIHKHKRWRKKVFYVESETDRSSTIRRTHIHTHALARGSTRTYTVFVRWPSVVCAWLRRSRWPQWQWSRPNTLCSRYLMIPFNFGFTATPLAHCKSILIVCIATASISLLFGSLQCLAPSI